MQITDKWLKEHKACMAGRVWVNRYHPNTEGIELVRILAEHRFDWANWLIVELLDKQQKVQYATYAAQLVLHVFEEKCPEDNSPRRAIEAAERGHGVHIAADVAASAAYTAHVASDAANAANAAHAAACAAYTVTYTIDAITYDAHIAAYLAADAAYTAHAAKAAIKQDIVDYGD